MHDDILVVDWLPNESVDTLWVFNEHARERITGELALDVVEQIIRVQPEKRVTIIPVLNVWGRVQVEHGDSCRRKNRNEVDTNRNYQLKRHHYDVLSEEYEGPHPLSEKETQLVADILSKGIKRYINVHSGEFSMYMPYDSNTNPPPHADKMRSVLTHLHPLCEECHKGQAAKVSFYKAYGTSVDYAIRIGVPEAYTFEIYGKNTHICKDMFNPRKSSEYIRVLTMWSKILFTSLNIE
tara:strand:+ start:682 stop:1395 length:714 start_codon:yes stop_codon:yes gene_type:complete